MPKGEKKKHVDEDHVVDATYEGKVTRRTLAEEYVGKVVSFGAEPFEVRRFEQPTAKYPKGRYYTTRHDHHHAVVVSVDDDGTADLKVLPIGGAGSERKDKVPFSDCLVPGAWSPAGARALQQGTEK